MGLNRVTDLSTSKVTYKAASLSYIIWVLLHDRFLFLPLSTTCNQDGFLQSSTGLGLENAANGSPVLDPNIIHFTKTQGIRFHFHRTSLDYKGKFLPYYL